ncbi:MAG: hypothetical protein ACOYNF_10290, partial [Rhodoferax sp.]
DKVAAELERRLKKDLTTTGDFQRIHPMPQTGADVPDDLDARLVVLGTAHPFSREAGNPAELAAKAMLEQRGNTPRLYRNTLVFLAADKTRLQDLDEAARKYLAWQSILADEAQLGLTTHQKIQVTQQMAAADGAATARLQETWQWLLVPVQSMPQVPVSWESLRLTGTDALAVRASKKLRSDELYLTSFAATRLKMELDRVPLWRGNHVPVKQLVEDFARYVYLPRLKNSDVLLRAASEGVSLLTWLQDGFGLADGFDEAAQRYQGLRAGTVVSLTDAHSTALLVKPELAVRQMDAERAAVPPEAGLTQPPADWPEVPPAHPVITPPKPPPGPVKPKRFHGSVNLDATRVGRDASKIAEEVIAHLAGLVGATVTVTLEISADIPGGVPDQAVRTVTENSRTLKFDSGSGFERE